MIKPKTIGRILLICFATLIGFVLLALFELVTNNGPSDGPGYEILALVLILLATIYFGFTVWTWRLYMDYSVFNRLIILQYLAIFILGILTSVVGIVYLYFYI